MPASRGEGDGCHGDPGRRGGGERAGWKGSGGQVSPPHLRAGVAEIPRWPPPRDNRTSENAHTTVGGEGEKSPEATPQMGVFGAPLRVGQVLRGLLTACGPHRKSPEVLGGATPGFKVWMD